MLGSCSGCIVGLVAIASAAAGTVGPIGAGYWYYCWHHRALGVVVLKRWLKADDVYDVFGIQVLVVLRAVY